MFSPNSKAMVFQLPLSVPFGLYWCDEIDIKQENQST